MTIDAAFFEEIREAQVEVNATIRGISRLGEQRPWTESVCRELTSQFDQLRELISSAFMVRFHVFCDQLAEHESRERDLIIESFSVDIGCGD